jgi:hypothetical protein
MNPSLATKPVKSNRGRKPKVAVEAAAPVSSKPNKKVKNVA